MTNVSVPDTLDASHGTQAAAQSAALDAVARMLDCAERGDAGARSLLLSGHAPADAIRTRLAEGSRVVELSCSNPTLESFLPLRALLDALAPVLATEAEDVLRRHAPEIAAIHPDLTREYPAAAPAVALSDIALTPSERRSHRESEQAYRVISGVGRLVIDAQAACPSLAAAPLTLWWRDLDLADRPTLLTFRRLERWIDRACVPVLLVATLRGDAHARSSAADPSFDWRTHRALLVEAIERDLCGMQLRLDAPRDAGKPISLDAHRPAAAGAGPIAEALAALDRGDREEGCMQALFAIRAAVFELNLEAVMLLGSAIVAALPAGADDELDGARLDAERARLTNLQTSAALEFTLGRLDRSRDVLVATWKAVALAHTFLEDHERALRCYEQALALADDAAMRAQLHMYLGLLTGKRLHRIPDALALLKAGFDTIDGATDPAATLERGWLLNVSALMNFQSKRHRDAMQMVRDSFELMRPLSSSDAVHLQINLLSNISVLLEATKNVDRALDVWLQFARFLDGGSDVFAKHYLFREGGLRVKTGDLDGAMRCYRESFEKAKVDDDDYHAEIAARACGYVAHARGEFSDAARWYGLSGELLVRTGDYDDLPKILLAAALSSRRAGDGDAARELVARAQEMSARVDEATVATIKAAAHTLAATPDGDDADHFEADVIVTPSTKLNRPFALIAVPAAVPSQDQRRRA